MLLDPAIVGADPMGCRSFSPTFTTSASAAASIARGGYSVFSPQDLWIFLGEDNTVTASLPGSTQPPSANNAMFVAANTSEPLHVKKDGMYFSMIAVSAAGTARFSGAFSIGSP